MPEDFAESLATPGDVATALHTSEQALAQMRYRGTGPKFKKVGRRVLYSWIDVHEWVEAQTYDRTDRKATA